MPTWHLRRQNTFSVTLKDADEDSGRRLLALLEQVGQYAPPSVAEAVCDFVESAAAQLGYTGQAAFEIVEDDGVQRLVVITLGRLVGIGKRFWQWLPRPNPDTDSYGYIYADGDTPEPAKRPRYVSLPKGAVWVLRLPPELGTPRQHRRLLRRLEGASRLTPGFASMSADMGRRFGYDFVTHRDASERLQERLSRRWGSVMSLQQPVGPSSEYFFIARRLAFHHARALVREHLVELLNDLLPTLGIKGRVEVQGLATAEQIAAAIDEMHAGSISFGEALEVVKL
jgi:hypothetical protein